MLTTVLVLLAAPSPEAIDVEGHRADLKVWSDGNGHYIAAESNLGHVYYGDGKTFFEAAPYTTGSDGKTATATIRDMRYDDQSQTELMRDRELNLNVTCGKRVTKLTLVEDAKAKAMLGGAAFNRMPHIYKPYALARDTKGIYYFVDRGRYPDNERTFRVFVGPRGNMKEQKLSNIVHDSAGDIFATPSGDLRLVVGDPTVSEWVKGDKHTKLIDIPVEDNVTMIYNELGPYRRVRLGKPCDDL